MEKKMSVEVICKRVAGLDVHKKIIVGTVLLENQTGKLYEEIKEFGTMSEDLSMLCQWLANHKVELTVMESTGVYWKSIYAALEQAGLNAQVVNARHAKQVPGRKTDIKDSQWLASLARFGLVKGSFIPDQSLRDLRLLTRYRFKLQRMIASEKNRLHKIVDAAGIRLGAVVSDIYGVTAQNILKGLIKGESVETLLSYVKGALKKKREELRKALQQPLPSTHRFLLVSILDHIETMEKQRYELDIEIQKAMRPYQKYWDILQTIPGIDRWGAAALIAECGVDMKRFGTQEQFCSWAGMCPGNNESAGKRKSGKTRKGNNFLRTILCEISNAAIRTKSQFKDKYKTLIVRRGYKRTFVAIGHKLLRVIWSLFMAEKPYQDPGINYEGLVVQRNASRWLKALTKYGYAMAPTKSSALKPSSVTA
jgi:transposase